MSFENRWEFYLPTNYGIIQMLVSTAENYDSDGDVQLDYELFIHFENLNFNCSITSIGFKCGF